MSSQEARVRAALSRAIEWHDAPRLRVIEPGSILNGAVRRGLDDRGGLDAYTEITGYAISLHAFLRRRGGIAEPSAVETSAAEYLLRVQGRDRAYADRAQPGNGHVGGDFYTFDTAACIVGLARLAPATEGRRYLESALAAGRWLLTMQRPDGSFRAMITAGGEARDPGGFFGDGSCIHAKNAMALVALHAASGEAAFREAARRALDYTMTLQDADGAFWSTPLHEMVYTHAHAYACEGLLHAGAALGDGRYAESAARGIAWLASQQGGDGGWTPQHKAARWTRARALDTLRSPKHSDATAQAARLFRLAGERYEEPRRRAIAFLLECQSPDGGFAYRRTRFGVGSLRYTWCAQFAVQALAWDMEPARLEDLF